MSSAEERITELEILVTHQQRYVDELNEQLVAATKQIIDLEQRLRTLEGVVKRANLELGPMPADEKPPHY